MSLHSSVTSTDLLNQLLQHAGVPSAYLESANLKIGYKLLSPCGEGVSADFVAPLQEFPIQDFLSRVPTDDLGSRQLYVSMFSEDPTIFDQPIETMQWSPPASYVNVQQADNPPPEKFSCVVVHADTD